MASETPHESLACPRCGHGLEGSARAAAARGESQGICSECGLHLDWAALMLEARAPRWHVESRGSRSWLATRAIATLVRCARPFRFWSAIDLAVPLRLRGLVAIAVATALALHAIGVAARFTPDSTFWKAVERHRVSAPTGAAMRIAADAAFVILSPASRFTGSHLLQTGRLAATADGERWWQTLRFVGIAASMPWRESIKYFRTGIGALPTVGIAAAQGPPLVTPSAWPTIFGAFALATLSPLAILLLPVSLRRAKVRGVHFVRIVGTGVATCVPILVLAIVLDRHGASYFDFMIDPVTTYGTLNGHFFLILGSGCLAAIWTAAAAGRYLRLPNAPAIGIASATIGALVALHVLSHLHYGT